MELIKKGNSVPLEEALHLAGSGQYTRYVVLAVGCTLFAGIANLQMMSVVMPVASCDLHLDTFQKGYLTSVGLIGITLSSHLFGFLSDMYGRRRIMLIATSTSALVSLLSSLSPGFITLSTSWLIIGFMTGGIFSPGYVYVSEFCPKEVRARGVLVASAMCALATGFLPGMAWLIVSYHFHIPLLGGVVFTSWRLFIGLFPLTNLIPACLIYRLPESPKFQLNRGRHLQTLRTLRKMYAINHQTKEEDYPVESVCLDSFDASSQQRQDEGSLSLLEMCQTAAKQAGAIFSRRFIQYILISITLMIGILGMYNTFVLWLPHQAKILMLPQEDNRTETSERTMCDILSLETEAKTSAASGASCDLKLSAHLPGIAVGLIQSLTFLLVSSFADRVEKKYIIGVLTGVSAVANLLMDYATQFWLIVLCLGLRVVLLLTTYSLTLTILVDFFPTSLRSTAASITLLFGRLSSVLCSQVFGFLYRYHCGTANWIAAGILLGVAVLAAVSPSKRKEETENSSI